MCVMLVWMFLTLVQDSVFFTHVIFPSDLQARSVGIEAARQDAEKAVTSLRQTVSGLESRLQAATASAGDNNKRLLVRVAFSLVSVVCIFCVVARGDYASPALSVICLRITLCYRVNWLLERSASPLFLFRFASLFAAFPHPIMYRPVFAAAIHRPGTGECGEPSWCFCVRSTANETVSGIVPAPRSHATSSCHRGA